MSSGGRIRRVRFKDGRPDLVILHTPQNDGAGENYRGKIIEHARAVADMDGDLAGFLVLGFFRDGAHSAGFRIADDCPMPTTLMPAYVAEVLRRYLVVAREAEDVFFDNFQWVE